MYVWQEKDLRGAKNGISAPFSDVWQGKELGNGKVASDDETIEGEVGSWEWIVSAGNNLAERAEQDGRRISRVTIARHGVTVK